jgi:radical SAM protein
VGAVRPDGYVYDRAPMIVYWETTLACGLSCEHCRATAMPGPQPGQLTTEEGLDLLDQVSEFGDPLPHIVFTGGDPLRRSDLEFLVHAATERGIGASLAPAVTPDLTKQRLADLMAVGIQTISLSLDGSTAMHHDGLRCVPGTFDMTMEAFDWAAELGLPVQVNTLVTQQTLADLPAVYGLLTQKTLLRWALFFLISVGRGEALTEIRSSEAEHLFHRLFRLAEEAPFQIKTTEATHYRRIAGTLMRAEGMSDEEIAHSAVGRGFGIRDGNGIVFVSHAGDVCPSGFLPQRLGNVRETSLVDLYRDHPTFRALRDVSSFEGRCGVCEFNEVCGGSRARAFAHSGNPLASDPLCSYRPSV